MHCQIVLYFAQAFLDLRAQRGLRILLQERLQSLFGFAGVRDVAIRQSHLPHFTLGNFQHRVVGELVRGKKRQPILISLARLNQRAGRAFEIEGIGDRQFSQGEIRRIRIRGDDRCE